MWASEKRRARELEKRNERLYYKFVYEYTKCLHPNVYVEAVDMYRKIRELYPTNVKDITKTVEFLAATKPEQSIPRYYYARKTIKPHNDREMVLEIPLLTPDEMPLAMPPVAAPEAPVAAPEAQCPTTTTTTTHVQQPPPLLLESHIYDELLKEIQNDPQLNQILSDFTSDVPPDAGTADTDLNQILSDFTSDVPPDAGTADTDLNQILSDFTSDVPPDDGTIDTELKQILSEFPRDFPDTPVGWNDDVMGLTPLERELQLY